MDDTQIAQLVEHRQMLLVYVRKKIADPELAEDTLQQSLLKALRAAPGLRENDKLLPWFFRILNNTITDIYRHQGVTAKYLEKPGEHLDLIKASTPEDTQDACACFYTILPSLKPEYAELIEGLDLSDKTPEQVAARLGINRNNLKVRHFRARQALRQRLEETCRVCAEHGCLDCDCKGH